MKTKGAKIVSNLGWAIGKSFNLIGALGYKVAREIANKPKHNIEVINVNTGEIMHKANNVSTRELVKILDAMRTLRGAVEIVIKKVR